MAGRGRADGPGGRPTRSARSRWAGWLTTASVAGLAAVTGVVRASWTRPIAVTSTARPTPTPLRAVRRVVSPSSPTPTARLAMGLTTVMTGSEIIGRPAWYAVWVSSREIGP